MKDMPTDKASAYRISVEPLDGPVSLWHGDTLLATSSQARVMYETRLPPTVYFPTEDVQVPVGETSSLQTFCPFKGTASYRNIRLGDDTIPNGIWSYLAPLPESRDIAGHVGFMPQAYTRIDLGRNRLRPQTGGDISGPVVNWLLREAGAIDTPEGFTRALALKLRDHGVALSRMSVLIWSLHPLIAGRNHIWTREDDAVRTNVPSYEIHESPGFINSPLRHVSDGLGGIRQRLATDLPDNSFPIIEDLRAQGATDYVAMPLVFSDGRINVLTLTSDHPDGFTTANLGLIFELSGAIARYFEVFSQRETARSLLETYVGRRTGARVLGGEIRRGDGDEIDAAIMFCDLRGSTRLEEELGRGAYIELLNRFFETVSTRVHDHGGEVLKFIGDAVLAVFPAGDDPDEARRQALDSARAIVAELDTARNETGGPPLNCAIGLSFGSVTYGNVGSRERLDFTVIGRAANIAARLSDHGKALGHAIVVSSDIGACCGISHDLGAVELHNLSDPVQCFAVAAKDGWRSREDSNL